MSTLFNNLIASVRPHWWCGMRVEFDFCGNATAVDEGLKRPDIDEEACFDAGTDCAVNLYKNQYKT